jgi:hypothetical protein
MCIDVGEDLPSPIRIALFARNRFKPHHRGAKIHPIPLD